MNDAAPISRGLLQSLRRGCGGKRVMVVGDLMLDRYIRGDVKRLSPEAPIPVLSRASEDNRIGGAGNVAVNLARLGMDVAIAGVVGQDEDGDQLTEMLQAEVDTAAVLRPEDRRTTIKCRIIAAQQNLLRIDSEDASALTAETEQNLAERVLAALDDGLQAVVLSDYAKGVLSTAVCRRVIDAAKAHSVPVLVDPKGLDFGKYAGATALTPNLRELALVSRLEIDAYDALIASAQSLVGTLDCEFIVLTEGAKGMTLITADETLHSAARAREVFDVSGAGDTVIATLTAGIVGGLPRTDMLHLANLAAGCVVARLGTVPIRMAELQQAVRMEHPDPECTMEELQVLLEAWRSHGERIVFTNGCFDLLHAGHVACLQAAAAAGDRLIVGLNSDASVRALKGPARPVNPERDRASIVSALAAVDAVVLFDDETPLALIEAVRPDVLVKGGDYRVEDVVGHAQVESWGGRVELVPLVAGKSTTRLLDKISSQKARDQKP